MTSRELRRAFFASVHPASGEFSGSPSDFNRSSSAVRISSSISSAAIFKVHLRRDARRSSEGLCGIAGRNSRIALGGAPFGVRGKLGLDVGIGMDDESEGVGDAIVRGDTFGDIGSGFIVASTGAE
jgi:hypothetical protein